MNVAEIRACLRWSIPQNLFDNDLDPRTIYVPFSHWKALDPARALVIGDRGTGKTFWWEALASPEGARLLERFAQGSAPGGIEVKVAYGAKSVSGFAPPAKDTRQKLFRDFPARAVWKTLLLAQAVPDLFDSAPQWGAKVRWVEEHPEESDEALRRLDAGLSRDQKLQVFLFDAIDSVVVDWSTLVAIHRELCELLLDLRVYRSIRAKAFVRRDIVADPNVLTFPDSSKLRTAAVELNWNRTDLYGLLWQYLANGSDESASFRSLRRGWESYRGAFEMWQVPIPLRESEAEQAALWHRLAGNWMGANERKGDTYTWLTNHLADSLGRVSPRSFLTAVRVAAEKTRDTEATPIHHTTIQEGVREASEIRAREIGEDFPWMKTALDVLGGLLVPCTPRAMISAWEHADLGSQLDRDESARRRRSQGKGLDALVEELVELGVIQRLNDGRINVPDVYRLGFGMRRKGGVRPRS